MRHAAVDVDVLADDAPFADLGALHDVREVPDLRALAHVGAVVDIGRLVHEVRRARRGRRAAVQRDVLAVLLQRTLAGVEHLQHPQAFVAVGDRRLARRDAVEESLALGLERLAVVERHRLRLRP